jgi:hypothetical protein
MILESIKLHIKSSGKTIYPLSGNNTYNLNSIKLITYYHITNKYLSLISNSSYKTHGKTIPKTKPLYFHPSKITKPQ